LLATTEASFLDSKKEYERRQLLVAEKEQTVDKNLRKLNSEIKKRAKEKRELSDREFELKKQEEAIELEKQTTKARLSVHQI